MRYFLFIILFILSGCASQMRPTGGPIDNKGPVLLDINLKNNFIIMNTDEKIILYFDEPIYPISAVNAVHIQNFQDFNIKVQGKKIIIKPNTVWPDFNFFKINISRSISDIHGNIISEPIQLFFSNNDLTSMYNKKINGQIINSKNELFELALYQIQDSSYHFIETIESSDSGNFEFSYLKSGKYIIFAAHKTFENIEYDIRNKKYGFINVDYIDLINHDSLSIDIQVSNPLERLFIQSFNQINNSFGYLIYNNGSTQPIVINANNKQCTIIDSSLSFNISLDNRIEKYEVPNFTVPIINIIDTISPQMLSHHLMDNKFHIIFDEPINQNLSPNLYHIQDSNIYDISYTFSNPWSIQFNISNYDNVYLESVSDIYGNPIIDTLSIDLSTDLNLDKTNNIGGNIYGIIKYNNIFPITIKAESINSDYVYYTNMNSDQTFEFINLSPGFYNFSAYEILGDYDYTKYFSGSWNPFKRASKFQYYDQTLEVRNHWDIKDMVIEIK